MCMEKCFLILLISSIAQLQAADISRHVRNHSEKFVNSLHYNGKPNSNSIEKIDVVCDSDNGMFVTIDFTEIFNGIIYSQGYFHDPACRYVDAGESRKSFAFNVPFDGCGSVSSCSQCSSVENVLIIQNENDIQYIFDSARKVTCKKSLDEQKTLLFKPFVVDTLEVISVGTSSGLVTCWMEIGTGNPPNLDPINNAIKLGEDITFTININSTQYWDVNIFQCFAYDNADFSAPSTKKILLSDSEGCTVHKNLFVDWKVLNTTKNSQQISIYYNKLKAFKFPDKPQVFLKCDIELCNGHCNEKKDCSNIIYKANKEIDEICFLGSLNPICHINGTYSMETENFNDEIFENEKKTENSVYFQKSLLGSKDSPPSGEICKNHIEGQECFANKQNVPRPHTSTVSNTQHPPCYPSSHDPQCLNGDRKAKNFPPPSTERNFITTAFPQKKTGSTTSNLKGICTPDSKDPECLNCFPGSPDPRCPKIPTTLKPGCYNGSEDPKCKPATYLPPTTKWRVAFTTTQKPLCFPGSNDPSCSKPGDDHINTRCYPGSRDPNCTSSKPGVLCATESTDPKCLTVPSTSRQKCYPGSDDPKCKTPTYFPPTTSRPDISTIRTMQFQPCFPGSQDPKCIKKEENRTRKPCYPGSDDPVCKNVELGLICASGSTDLRCFNKTPSPKPNCYQGSTDPRCEQGYYSPPPTTERNFKTIAFPHINLGSTTSNPKGICTPDSKDPECLNCFPGSPDPRCPKVPTTLKPGCYNGSEDPKCKPATYLPPTTKGRVAFTTTQKPQCFPGSNDPSCSKPGDDHINTRCYPGSRDPNCTSSKPGILCTAESTDPKCLTVPSTPRQKCYPGSDDPKCKVPTYFPSTSSRPDISTVRTMQFQPCYPGSQDPKCNIQAKPMKSPLCFPDSPAAECCDPKSNNPECNLEHSTTFRNSVKTLQQSPNEVTSTPNYCYPGSIDPRCPNSGYIGTSRVPASYLPPLFNSGERESRLSLFDEINRLSINGDLVDLEDENLEDLS